MDPSFFISNSPEAMVAAPFVRIQTLLQTQDMIPTLKFSKPIKGVLDCFSRVSREEGKRGFWRAFMPTLLLSYSEEILKSIRTGQSSKYGIEADRYLFGENGIFTKINDTLRSKGILRNENRTDSNPFMRPGLELSIFAFLSQMILHPLFVLQVRMGADFGNSKLRKYSGFFSTMKGLASRGGITAFYRGFLPFSLYTVLQKNYYAEFFREESVQHMDIAKMFACETLIYPLYLLSCRLMMTPDNTAAKYKGLIHCAKGTFREFGLKGFYRGFSIEAALFGMIFGALLISGPTTARV